MPIVRANRRDVLLAGGVLTTAAATAATPLLKHSHAANNACRGVAALLLSADPR
jgi:hypothetical protein